MARDNSEPRAEDKTEITPEMVEAGVDELLLFNDDFESREEAVRRIYSAMRLAFKTALASNAFGLNAIQS